MTTESDEPFVAALRRLMAEFQSPFVPGLPRFTGGAVGFIGYDASPVFEPALLERLGEGAVADERHRRSEAEDDAGFMLFDTVLAFDHVKHRILIIANARVTADEDLQRALSVRLREDPVPRARARARPVAAGAADAARRRRSARTWTRETYEAGVRTIKERIAAGDIYQAVLSQRFEADVTADPFTVYRALRHVNPSPYMYFIRMGGLAIVGSSPEMLVRVEGRRVETHPIAGTRPRGRTTKRICGWPRS